MTVFLGRHSPCDSCGRLPSIPLRAAWRRRQMAHRIRAILLWVQPDQTVLPCLLSRPGWLRRSCGESRSFGSADSIGCPGSFGVPWPWAAVAAAAAAEGAAVVQPVWQSGSRFEF